jgi:hypothetical protein
MEKTTTTTTTTTATSTDSHWQNWKYGTFPKWVPIHLYPSIPNKCKNCRKPLRPEQIKICSVCFEWRIIHCVDLNETTEDPNPIISCSICNVTACTKNSTGVLCVDTIGLLPCLGDSATKCCRLRTGQGNQGCSKLSCVDCRSDLVLAAIKEGVKKNSDQCKKMILDMFTSDRLDNDVKASLRRTRMALVNKRNAAETLMTLPTAQPQTPPEKKQKK